MSTYVFFRAPGGALSTALPADDGVEEIFVRTSARILTEGTKPFDKLVGGRKPAHRAPGAGIKDPVTPKETFDAYVQRATQLALDNGYDVIVFRGIAAEKFPSSTGTAILNEDVITTRRQRPE